MRAIFPSKKESLFFFLIFSVWLSLGLWNNALSETINLNSEVEKKPITLKQRLNNWMEDARQSMAKKDYRRAVELYNQILKHPNNQHGQNALEYLGLARERLKQKAHAIKTYKKYLKRYPKGENAERIKQRLLGITTARERPRKKLRKAKKTNKNSAWRVYGSASQYYRRNENTINNNKRVNYSSLNSGLTLSARRRANDLDMRSRLNASYEYSLLPDAEKEPIRISSLYFDAKHQKNNWSGRMGRQTNNRGGVLGRFDGITLGYQVFPKSQINLITGFPVNFQAMDKIDTKKKFYGINLNLGTYARAYSANIFAIEQKVSGFIDRRAVGMELRYFRLKKSLTTIVDYDIYFKTLNMFLIQSHWTFPSKTRINTTFDFRKSPLMTTSNALIGQSITTLGELHKIYNIEDIKTLARNRTITSYNASLGLSQPIGEKFQINGYVTASSFSNAPASGGVNAIPPIGPDFFYSLQFSGNSLWKAGDFNTITLRYSDTSNSQSGALLTSMRFPVGNGWRINPRMRIDIREYQNNSTKQRTLSPSMRITYRWRKRYNFDIDLGKTWTQQVLETSKQINSSLYFNAGFRINF